MVRLSGKEIIKELSADLERERSIRYGAQDEQNRLVRQLTTEQQRNAELIAHNAVLQSDRDRLTSTVEILSRRLASPTAELRLIGGERISASGAFQAHTSKH